MDLPKRQAVINLHNDGKTRMEIVRALKALKVTPKFVTRTIKRFLETGSLQDRVRSGRPRSVRTSAMVKAVRERVRRNPQRSQRKLAGQLGISRRSVQRVLKNDLRLRPYKRCKRQALTAAAMEKRLVRCRQLLQRHGDDAILFSDEKIFNVQEKLNIQNNRVYSLHIEDIPLHLRICQRRQNPASVMVWGGISEFGKTPLIFLESGARLNAQMYISEILEVAVKNCGESIFSGRPWVFQQDGAPCHTAKVTQDWCQANLPGFIPKDLWPPYSPDLNPMDYFVWSYLEARVNSHEHTNVEALRCCVMKEWIDLPLDLCRAAVGSWRKRLGLCMKAKGGYFEL